jgi:hypothetical protein
MIEKQIRHVRFSFDEEAPREVRNNLEKENANLKLTVIFIK